MNGVYASRGVGQYASTADASGGHLFLGSKAWKRDGSCRGIILCHGAGGTDLDANGQTNTLPNFVTMIAELAAAGWPILSINAAGLLPWGNDAAIATFAEAKTFLQGTFGAKSGKVILAGPSMGGLTALNMARANPTLVEALLLWEPVCDLADMVTNNRGGYAASINTAYGTYNDGTQGPTHSPVQFGGTLSAIPTMIWNGSTDTTAVPSTVTALAAAIGAAADVHTVASGHGDTLFPLVDRTLQATFLAAHA